MLDFILLHLSALSRSTGILDWCASWLPAGLSLLPLQPIFAGYGLSDGAVNPDGVWQPTGVLSSTTVFLWSPPPSAAVEQLAFSRHKRPGLSHVFICPRLMTHLWRKRLLKTTDVSFLLHTGLHPDVRSDSLFEPLIVGVCLPFLTSCPWSCRSYPPILEVAGQLSGLRANPERDERALLRELWSYTGGGCATLQGGKEQ
jgi:hypothetical protein